MRRHSLGALFLFSGLIASSQVFCESPEGKVTVLEAPDGRESGDVSFIDKDIIEDQEQWKSAELKYDESNLVENPVLEPPPMDDVVAYWEAIYGTHDVPEFEVPPPIEGESVFMDLENITDSWDLQDYEDSTILVKRDASKDNKSEEQKSGDMDYKKMMGNVYRDKDETASLSNLEMGMSHDLDDEMESDFENSGQIPSVLQPRSVKLSKDSDALLDSKRKVIESKKDFIRVAAAGGTKAELSNAVHRTIEAKKDLIDSVVSVQARTIETKKDWIDSAASCKCKHVIEAKKDLIDSVISSKAGLIKTKKDLIDSVVSSKSSALQHKKEFIQSASSNLKNFVNTKEISGVHTANSTRSHTTRTQISSHRNMVQSVLDSKRKIIQGKKDIMHAAAGGHRKEELTDAIIKTLDAKKDIVDLAISNKAELSHHSHKGFADLFKRREHDHWNHGTLKGFGRTHKNKAGVSLNSPCQNQQDQIFINSQSEFQNMKHEVNSEAKSKHIDLAGSGKIETEVSSIVNILHGSSTSPNTTTNLESSSYLGGDIGSEQSSMYGEHAGSESLILNKNIESNGRISSNLESGKVASIENSGILDLKLSGSTATKLGLGTAINHHAQGSSVTFNNEMESSGQISSHLDSGSYKNTGLEQSGQLDLSVSGGIEKHLSHEDIINHHEKSSSLTLDKNLQTDGIISSNLETSLSGAAISEGSGLHDLGVSSNIESEFASGITVSQEKNNIPHPSSIEINGDTKYATDGRLIASVGKPDDHNRGLKTSLNSGIHSSHEFSGSLHLLNSPEIKNSESADISTTTVSQEKSNIPHPSSIEIDEDTKYATDGRLIASVGNPDNDKGRLKTSLNSGIHSSHELSSSLQLLNSPEIKDSESADISTTLNSKVSIDKNIELGSNLRSEQEVRTIFSSGVTESVEDKSYTNGHEGHAELKVSDESQIDHATTETRRCGISGKLCTDSNPNSAARLSQQGEIQFGVYNEFHRHSEDPNNPPNYEEIPKPALDLSVITEKGTDTDQRSNEQPEHAQEIGYSKETGDEGLVEDNEGHIKNAYNAEQDQRDLGTTAASETNIGFDGEIVSELSLDHRISFADLKKADHGSDSYDIENNDGLTKFGKKLGHSDIQNEFLKDLIAHHDNLFGMSLGEEPSGEIETVLTVNKELTNDRSKYGDVSSIDLENKFESSLNIGDQDDDSNSEFQSSTNEENIEKYYDDDIDDEELYYETGDSPRFSASQTNQNIEINRAAALCSNTHCRLINLDVNCTGSKAFLNPECLQLNTNLWHPLANDSRSPITLQTVKSYFSRGQALAKKMQNRAKWLCDKGLMPKVHTSAMLHLFNNLATESTVGINQKSKFGLFGTKLLQQRLSSDFNITPNTFSEFLRHDTLRVVGTGLCHNRPKRCPVDQMYRSFDGSCNNQRQPTWGQTNTAFARVLPARYFDGIHEIPRSVTGRRLPNARSLSVYCFSRQFVSDQKLTLVVVQWGQILSHDLAMQNIDQSVEGGIECCANGRQLPKKLQHHSCLPITISPNDKFYSKFNQRCMNFVRSMTVSREDCTLGPAEQLNTVSSYLDASPVYGSDKETCDRLRSFTGGRVLVEIRRGREILPTMTNRSRFCDVMSPNEVCYRAGDIRVNQNPQLAVLQTILVREHNKIADELQKLNSHWDDERVFQETRRIVIAVYQHITYNEWLPLIIGKKYCQKHRLVRSGRDGQMSRDYDPLIKAATINGFTTAAFRFFHTMVTGSLSLCPANREISHTLRLSNHFFRPQIIEQSDNLDDLIRGFATQPMQRADNNFSPEITEYLFRSKNVFGLDLEAFDIQRGRDHGLPGYNAYRKICGLQKAKNFNDLIQDISYENIEKLEQIYAHVDDIDLIIGVTLERKSPESQLGPVARCLIGEQFYRSRIGDRYFYDNADQPHSFTQAQFKQIKKASLARLLCDTGDNVEEIQPRAFQMISRNNPLMSCSDLPRVDLSPWQESTMYYNDYAADD